MKALREGKGASERPHTVSPLVHHVRIILNPRYYRASFGIDMCWFHSQHSFRTRISLLAEVLNDYLIEVLGLCRVWAMLGRRRWWWLLGSPHLGGLRRLLVRSHGKGEKRKRVCRKKRTVIVEICNYLPYIALATLIVQGLMLSHWIWLI